MSQKEYFHTAQEYDVMGIKPFIQHIRKHILFGDTVPFARTSDHAGNDIFFAFSELLLNKIDRKPEVIKKPYEVAIKYGLQGYSRGGRNGIFYQREQDTNLIRMTEKLIEPCEAEIIKHLDLSKNGLDELKKVKIVWHKPDGERVVGLQNTVNNRMIFLGFANYNH